MRLGTSLAGNFGSEFFELALVFQIPNLDNWTNSGAEPVSVGREGHGVDDVVSGQGVQVLALVEVPEHGLSVLSSGST